MNDQESLPGSDESEPTERAAFDAWWAQATFTNCSEWHAWQARAKLSIEASPAEREARAAAERMDKANGRGARYGVDDLKLPLPALPEPFIESTEEGYALHRSPEVLAFGAACYRRAKESGESVEASKEGVPLAEPVNDAGAHVVQCPRCLDVVHFRLAEVELSKPSGGWNSTVVQGSSPEDKKG